MKNKKQSYYPKGQVKFPKQIARAEIFNQHDLTPEQKSDILKKNKIDRLRNESFNLNGAYPYLIDLINYLCTHYRERIERKDNPAETHYRVRLLKADFDDIILGKYKYQRDYLRKEIYRLIKGLDENENYIKHKVLPFTMNDGLLTRPIKIEIYFNDNKKIPVWQLSLNDITGESIKGYIIEFYKPLWQEVINSEKGADWFPFPARFHAKMVDFIRQHGMDAEFKKYGNFGNASNYRKLYLYLNLHDNSNSNKIKYDGIDLTKHCLPSNIKTKIDGTADIHTWWTTHQFTQKGMKLFYRMGERGLLDGVKLLPNSVWYDQSLKIIEIGISRDIKGLPEFNNRVNPEYEIEYLQKKGQQFLTDNGIERDDLNFEMDLIQ